MRHRPSCCTTKVGDVGRAVLSLVFLLPLLELPAKGAAPIDDPLVAGFEAPPPSARPMVYWQWINGNVTEEGIRRDLAWMHAIGLGGAFLFDVGFNSPPVPQYVADRVGFGTAAWHRAVRVAGLEANRLGLSFGAQSSGGWSVSGDPGVSADQAMKKLVWSETLVEGDRPVRLEPLPRTSGPFQDLPIADRFRSPEAGGEIAVFAYPAIAPLPRPLITGTQSAERLTDGHFDAAVKIEPINGSVTLTFTYARAVTPRALTLAVDGPMPSGTLIADGVERLQLSTPAQQPSPVRTYALAPVKSATVWSLRLTGLTAPIMLREARLEAEPRIHRFEDKAGFGTLTSNEALRSDWETGIKPSDIIDLTDRLRADGRLDWRPVRGGWRVLRFGWSLTGRRAVPAPPESTGLEVDKLDAQAVRAFATRFYDRMRNAVGADGRMDVALTDSWEAGQQSWTPAMRTQFLSRRGYDPLPWMPVLTGRVVGDTERSERFLADWRRTIADLLSDNHYGVFASVLKARGMTYYAEAPGTDLPTIADGIQAKARVDVPMGEYWFPPDGGPSKPVHIADIREAASAANLYGKSLVAAEALTTMGENPWSTGPREWRPIVDRFFAEGVNKVVLHTSAHQPWSDPKPGMTLRQYGMHFTRNEAWSTLAHGFVSYLSRSSFLLQQGRPAKDVVILYAEDAPASPSFQQGAYQKPKGYDYDLIDAQTLRDRLRVENGNLAADGGARYRVIALETGQMRLSGATVEALLKLVREGATLIGDRPVGPLGLDDPTRFNRAVRLLWSQAGQVRQVGQGKVYGAKALEQVLLTEGVPPAVTAGNALAWAHRILPDGDLFFLSNQSEMAFDAPVKLRIATSSAELWDAVDGSRQTRPGRGRWHVYAPAGSSRFDFRDCTKIGHLGRQGAAGLGHLNT